jgi:hypothetical protein
MNQNDAETLRVVSFKTFDHEFHGCIILCDILVSTSDTLIEIPQHTILAREKPVKSNTMH